MWVRTTLTIKRWTEEKSDCKTDIWDERESTGKGAGRKAGAWLGGALEDRLDLKQTLSSQSLTVEHQVAYR